MLLYGNSSFRTKRRLLIFFYTCESVHFSQQESTKPKWVSECSLWGTTPQILGDFQLAHASVNMG